MGDVLVTCNDGKICLKVINIRDENIELDMSILTMQEVEKMGKLTDEMNDENNKVTNEFDSTNDFTEDNRKVIEEC
jgi:hypothetical protein